MGRYLKKFSTNNEYQNYINDKSKLILPNVSLVEGDAYCYFIPNQIGEPGQPTPEPEVALTPTIHATFNATSENMVAFMETGNMKSLKIDGNQIDVGTPVPTQESLNIVGNDVTINMETREAIVSPEYLVNTSDVDFMSLKFTPTDKNISFDDYNVFALIIEMDGVMQAMPLPMEEIASMSMYLGMEYQSESHTVIVPQFFLTSMKMQGQINPTGLTGVFAKVNLEDGNIENFLDTTCNYYTVSGGLAGQYTFETEGTHEVEIELTDNSPTDMLFATSCVSNIISMKNIKSIAPHTFASCINLEEIAIPNDVTEIHCMAMYDTPITEFTIPNSVTSIGDFAFNSCESLTSITIPNSVTSIGNQVFQNCSSLTSVTIGDGVTTIGKAAFSGCTNLTSVDLGNSVTSIGESVFFNCKSLTSITIPDGVTEITYYAFRDCTSLTSITIPDSVTTIGERAFNGCSSLTSITIPNSVTSIGEGAFSSCKSLASVDLGNGVTTIGSNAFNNCDKLTLITIPNSVTTIGGYAFYSCDNLTSITIPSSVTTIDYSAFHNCSSLTSVYCKPTTPPAGGSSMFDTNASGRKIYVPMASVDAYKAAQYWSGYSGAIEGYNF